MTISYRKVCLFSALVLLSGCAQNRDVPTLQNQVVELKQMLGTLTDQATALERQNQLNQNSTSGVYLLPAANAAARLQSQIGELSVYLTHVKSEASGSQAMLHIRTLSSNRLPPFNAMVEWGQLDEHGQLLSAGALSQPITTSESLLAKTEQRFELRLSGLTPQQLGYIRLHNIEPLTAAANTATSE